MTGKELRKAIRGSGIKISELAERSGILEATIYSLYNKIQVEEHYLDKLQKAGVELEKTIKNNILPNTDTKVIDTLERLVQAHEKTIDHLKAEIRTLKNSGEVEALRLAVKAQEELLNRAGAKPPLEGRPVTLKKRD